MAKINTGDTVINPDIRNSESPNYTGIVERTYFFIIEGRKSNFAWVKFRDYEGGYSFSILKKVSPKIN